MDWNLGSDRIVAHSDARADLGDVSWSPIKSLWIGVMTLVAIGVAPFVFTWSAFAVFLITTAITLCAGHSVGMHRRLIHNSFECPLWLEYLCVYLGTLVGMAGPIGMIRQHDLRDWAQRKAVCHDYLCHRRNFWTDAYWQLHCELKLDCAPGFQLEDRLARNQIYAWMERTWMWQQLPWALLFYAVGDWSWVLWGICVRITISVTGHWLIGHFAHRSGPMSFRVENAGVQGHDVPIAALLSMGESWHNNHHAYPGSARLGVLPDQPDPGWWLIKAFERLDLAWNIKTPEVLTARKYLRRLNTAEAGCPFCRFIRIAIRSN